MSTTGKSTTPAISLRPASAEDDEFLLRVYGSAREEEMAPWGWNEMQRGVFVRMQFEARKRSYAASSPGAVQSIVSIADVPVGSIIVDRSNQAIRLVDIALLPEFRNRQIGTILLRRLIEEASRSAVPLRLSVLRGNRATRLYKRLGFVVTGSDEVYCEMELDGAGNCAKAAKARGESTNAR
jgi:ribosomal protein S18 acetylase RimI-like enzyme